jgi:hypothetical protein
MAYCCNSCKLSFNSEEDLCEHAFLCFYDSEDSDDGECCDQMDCEMIEACVLQPNMKKEPDMKKEPQPYHPPAITFNAVLKLCYQCMKHFERRRYSEEWTPVGTFLYGVPILVCHDCMLNNKFNV